MERFKNYGLAIVGAVLASPVVASAAVTMPELPVTDLETAGGVVLALIAVGVIIGMIARTLRKAG